MDQLCGDVVKQLFVISRIWKLGINYLVNICFFDFVLVLDEAV